MKSFVRITTVSVVAWALLASSAAWAQQPRYRSANGSYRTSRMQAAPDMGAMTPIPEPTPEPVATPPMSAPATGGSGPALGSQGNFLPEYEDAGGYGDGYSDGGGDGSCDTCSGMGCGFRNGMWYGSVDYLLVRPRFSQAVAEVRRTLITDTSVSPNTSTLQDVAVPFNFNYQSSFRVALGYRLLDCGGDIQFAFWRMTGSAQVNDGPADTINDNPFIAGQLKNNPGNGQFFSATAGVTANIYDIDFAKCLSFGGPKDPCDTCFCPRWDLRWSAGVRVGDISRFNNNASSDPDGTVTTSGVIDARFVGAGPRVGIQGRRFFGQCGNFAAYAKASQALLIGDFRMSRIKTTPGDAQVPTEITSQFDHYNRMIPVTDIEVGGTWQIAPYAFISAGWFFQCWWDLGMAETVIGTNFGPLDTANILGFDGLFVRGEMLF